MEQENNSSQEQPRPFGSVTESLAARISEAVSASFAPPAEQPPAPAEQPPAPAEQPPAPAEQPPAPAEQPADIASRYSDPKDAVDQPPAQLPEVPPEQDIRLPEGAGESAAHAFAAARAEMKKYKKLAEEYRAASEKARADYDSYAQREREFAEKLKAEQDRSAGLEESLGKLDLTMSPAFKRQYDVPIQEVTAQIKQVFVDNGVRDDAASELAGRVVLAASTDEVMEYVRDMPDIARGEILYKFKESEPLWAARSQAISDWKTTRDGLNALEVREDAAQSAQLRAQMADTAAARLESVVPANIWTDSTFVQYRENAIKNAKAWYGQASSTQKGMEQIAAAAMEGAVVAPYLYKMVNLLMSELVNARASIDARHRASSPSIVPLFQSPPKVAPPAPPPVPTTAGGQPVRTANTRTDVLTVAENAVANALRRMGAQ